MAGAFHGVTEADAIINVGVSGPGVMRKALEAEHGTDFGSLCETVKKTDIVKPKGTKIVKLKAGKKKITVKWKKLGGDIAGYQIQYSLSSKFKKVKTVTVSNKKTVRKQINKLKSKRKYYVKIRTYRIVNDKENSTKSYSSWSKMRSVKVK